MAGDDRETEVCAWLVSRGRLKDSDLGRARRLHEESAEGTLTTLMARLGLVSERDLAEGWAELLQVPLLSARDAPELPPPDLELSLRLLKQQHVVPVLDEKDGLALIVADPADPYPLQAVELAAGRPVALRVGLRSEIDGLIERYYGTGRSAMGAIVENLDGSAAEEDDVEHLRDLASEAPVIRLVNLILQRAVEQRASDVHIEPFENRLKVRYRIDGVLHEVEAPPSSSTAAVISRVKIMARLNIAERRLPQDGRIQLRVQGKELDLRVSTVPTSFGESVVMRILDRESVVFDFESLGFTDSFKQRFIDVLEKPHGILLVTGPTGSGKTTILYAGLERLNDNSSNIMTVEDPIEYYIDGIGQTQVNTKVEMTFARGLRAILRQDPDVVMIGETRDLETAQIAVQASLTGHLVLSTLHTNTAAGAVTRLRDMGIEPFLLSSSLIGVLAQRLVRVLNPESKRPFTAGEAERRLLNLAPGGPAPTLYRPGDDAMGGYRGRSGIYELIMVDDTMRTMIHDGASEQQIERHARHSTPSIRDHGRARVLRGETAIEEVLRVTRED